MLSINQSDKMITADLSRPTSKLDFTFLKHVKKLHNSKCKFLLSVKATIKTVLYYIIILSNLSAWSVPLAAPDAVIHFCKLLCNSI